jgi:thymidylate kinase
MKKLIVIEGPDLSGKTTLANALSEVTGLLIGKKNLWQPKNEEEHHKIVDLRAHLEYGYIAANQHLLPSFILDRFIISNIAYPRFYKRNYDFSYMKKEHWTEFELKLIFVSLEDEKIIEERLKRRGDFLKLDVEKIIGLRKEYEKAFEEFGMPYLKVDGSQPVHLSLAKILEYIK